MKQQLQQQVLQQLTTNTAQIGSEAINAENLAEFNAYDNGMF